MATGGLGMMLLGFFMEFKDYRDRKNYVPTNYKPTLPQETQDYLDKRMKDFDERQRIREEILERQKKNGLNI